MRKIIIGAMFLIGMAIGFASTANADDGDMTVIKQYEKFGSCAIQDGIVVNVRMGAKIYTDVSSGGKAGGGGGYNSSGHNTTGEEGTGGVTYTRQATRQFMYITIQCPTKGHGK